MYYKPVLEAFLHQGLHVALFRSDVLCQLTHLPDVYAAQKEHEHQDAWYGPGEARFQNEEETEGCDELDSCGNDRRHRLSQRLCHHPDILHHTVQRIAGMESFLPVPPAFHKPAEEPVAKSVLQNHIAEIQHPTLEGGKKYLNQHTGHHDADI